MDDREGRPGTGKNDALMPTTSCYPSNQTKKWLIPHTEPNNKNGYP
jgi:hypothetical protein